MSDIRNWLEEHGLGEFTAIFVEERVELETLPDLTEQDLKDLGFPLGSRKKLLRAISSLNEGSRVAPDLGPVESPPTTAMPSGGAERRQLTVMFCDLVGSTELAQRLDPEDLRLINRHYQELAREAIESHEGFVARYMGDGVLAYFGYPVAHEDDPELAVRAGHALIKALVENVAGEPIAARIGIATGPVVVGDLIGEGSSLENAVVGETPNLAARLQALAPPNGIVAAEATRRLVGDIFRFLALPAQDIRGFVQPVQAYQVGVELVGQSRFGAHAGTTLSPFLGREEEMELLMRRWHRAERGEGGAVLLIGDPGIGKSRLVEQLRLEAIASAGQVLLFQCSSNYRNTAFHPVLARLESTIRPYAQSELGTVHLIHDFVAGNGLEDDEETEVFASLLAEALGVDGVATPASLEALDADGKRRQLMSALGRFIENHARAAPLLCVFEDLHWADPSTIELLSHLVEGLSDEPILLLATTRTGFQPAWSDDPHARIVSLPRLSGTVAGALASAIAPLSNEALAQVVDRAGGNPLFIEELAQSLSNSAAGTRAAQLVPATLQDSLMARLDATGPGRAVAQCASVLGREFGRAMLRAAWDGDPPLLDAGVQAVVDAGLLYERTTTGGQQEYQFKHALVRDAAYSSLLRERRRVLHRRTAEQMIRLRSENARAASFEVIAHHLSEANDVAGALKYLFHAGEAAARISSYQECEAHLRQALALIERSEDPSAHDRNELEILVLLGPALMALYGYSAASVGEAYERARVLAEGLPEKSQLTAILNGLRLHYLCRLGPASGHETASALVAHAEVINDDASRIEGSKGLGTVLVWSGRFEEAGKELGRAIDLYDVCENADAMRLDSDSGLTCHSFISLVDWASGRIDKAIRHMETAQAIAHRARRTFGIGECMCFRALLLQLMREHDRAETTAKEAFELAVRHDYVLWQAMSSLVHGAALTAKGETGAGLESLLRADRLMTEMDYIVWRPIALAELGHVYGLRGDRDAALHHVDEALATIDRTKERFWQPEAHRYRGLILLDAGEVGAADEAFRHAVDCADELEHRMYSLRACTSLAMLALETGTSWPM